MTLAELGLIEENLDFEFIQLENEFNVKINGLLCFKITQSQIEDLHTIPSFDIVSYVKSAAIDYYVNNLKVIRKLKLEKIK